MNLQGGIAVSLNATNGEFIDPINDQGVIGYLDHSKIESESSIFLCLEFEKIKSIYIPKLTVGEEKILLPALHLPEFRSISLVVGNSGNKNESEFSNPHLMVTKLDCGLASWASHSLPMQLINRLIASDFLLFRFTSHTEWLQFPAQFIFNLLRFLKLTFW